jgi:hypothetical protein
MANAITFGTAAARAFGFTSKASTGGAGVVSYTFTTNTSNAALAMSSISGYVAGSSNVTITVNSGVYLWASTTSNYGLTLTGGQAGDQINFINNGYIIGCGGAGSAGASLPSYAGSPGGNALKLGYNTFITNNSYIAAGGGGAAASGGGGGAGGGAGGAATVAGGTGGGIGASGGNGAFCGPCGYYSGGGGGRILPGVGGTGYNAPPTSPSFIAATGGGAGGGGGSGQASPGGTGGSANGAPTSNGGGGWGSYANSLSIAPTYPPVAGGAGGYSIALNGFIPTFVTKGTIYGAILL